MKRYAIIAGFWLIAAMPFIILGDMLWQFNKVKHKEMQSIELQLPPNPNPSPPRVIDYGPMQASSKVFWYMDGWTCNEPCID